MFSFHSLLDMQDATHIYDDFRNCPKLLEDRLTSQCYKISSTVKFFLINRFSGHHFSAELIKIEIDQKF